MTDKSVYVPPKGTDWTPAKPKSKASKDMFSEQAIRAFMDKHLNETTPSPQMRGVKARKKQSKPSNSLETCEINQQPDARWQQRLGLLISRLRSR
ncbi:MAG: hypothetical protein AB3N15_04680 [Paracoccaceae bacterium]